MKLDKIIAHTKQRQQNNQRQPRAKPVKEKRAEMVGPTPEAEHRGEYCEEFVHHHESGTKTKAVKRTAVIDTMLSREQITTAHYIALSYYRGQAIAADRSPIKSNIDFTVRSGNPRPLGYKTPQQIETDRIEADLGKLRAIVRAVAVNDVSLSQWCVDNYGGKEVLRGRKVVIEPSRKNMEAALKELISGAEKIVT